MKFKKRSAVIVTGAPGSGKTTVIEYLLKLNLENTAIFDIDSISKEASDLAEKDIHFSGETWVPFRKIWVNILKSVAASGITPVLFAASDREDFDTLADGLELRWIALDCDDRNRLKRLEYRGYTGEQIDDVLQDAQKIRKSFDVIIDTTDLNPEAVAKKLLNLI